MGTSTTASRARQSAPTSKKRTRDKMLGGKITGTQTKPIQIDDDQDKESALPVKVKRAAKTNPKADEEKRLKKHRKSAPLTWLARLERATNQRMFLIDRQRTENDGVPQETFELAGSTGNVYTIVIKQLPSCTCLDAMKGNLCKHIIYILRLVLKAPADLEYQAAFLTSELRRIFDKSPVPQHDLDPDHPDETHRKPVNGDCPVCFMEFEPASEEITWCKAACGNNIHKECFEKWAKSNGGKEVRCVYCRTVWKGDEPSLGRIRAAKGDRALNSEGYINLGSELGMSTNRDVSTYHGFWVNQQHRIGNTSRTR